RLTGWISLVGQHRDPLTGHVLSELYQVHESALGFQQACALDASLPALLHASIGHENNQVDRVAIHIQATLAQAPEAASTAAHDQFRDDDDLPPTPPSWASEAADPLPLPGDSAGSMLVPQQTGHARHMTAEQGSTYKTYMYKKERTYRAREGDGDPASQSVSLPPEQCPGRSAKGRAGRLAAAAAAASPGSTRRVAGTQPERHRAQRRGLLLRLGEARICWRVPLVGRSPGGVCR